MLEDVLAEAWDASKELGDGHEGIGHAGRAQHDLYPTAPTTSGNNAPPKTHDCEAGPWASHIRAGRILHKMLDLC